MKVCTQRCEDQIRRDAREVLGGFWGNVCGVDDDYVSGLFWVCLRFSKDERASIAVRRQDQEHRNSATFWVIIYRSLIQTDDDRNREKPSQCMAMKFDLPFFLYQYLMNNMARSRFAQTE